MTLTLTVAGMDRLDNGEPARIVLDRHGAVIGRSPSADWSLPDPKAHVSGTHCEIDFRGGQYLLIDKSTNGTFVNGSAQRLAGPHVLESGDEISIGGYKLTAMIAGQEPRKPAPASSGGWADFGGPGAPAPAAAPSAGSWGAAAWDGAAAQPSAAASAWDASPAPASSAWGASAAPAASNWEAASAPSATGGSAWGESTPSASPSTSAWGGGGESAAPAASSWGASEPSAAAGAWGAPAAAEPSPAPAASWGGAAPAAGPSVDWGASGGTPAETSAWSGSDAAASGGWGGAPAAATPAAWGSGASSAPGAAHAPADAAWGAGPPPPHAEPAWGAAADPSAAADPWGEGAAAAMSGRGAMSQAWTPPKVETQPASAPAADWSAPAAAPSGGGDVWSKLASSNSVDWGRGFGEPAGAAPVPAAQPAPSPPPAAAPAMPPPLSPTPLAVNGTTPSLPPTAPAPLGPPPAMAGSAPADGAWTAFLSGAGVAPADLKTTPAAAAEAAGQVLKKVLAGLVVMLEARARAKAQLGASSTSLEFDGNNPLKFARNPERVVAQMINPTERGFMAADRAVEDAFLDLQAHQLATLAAMQGALRSTLDRFSPEAIRGRAEMRGVLARILPGARDATLWQAYEREFEGVARGSDEAFMDVFAKAFKEAYERTAAEMKAKR